MLESQNKMSMPFKRCPHFIFDGFYFYKMKAVLNFLRLGGSALPDLMFLSLIKVIIYNLRFGKTENNEGPTYMCDSIPINAVSSKSEIAIKTLKTNYCVKYLPPKQTLMQTLI